MNGLKTNNILLFLTKLPNRKGYCFCFEEDGVLTPVAYVPGKLEGVAIDKWNRMLGG